MGLETLITHSTRNTNTTNKTGTQVHTTDWPGMAARIGYIAALSCAAYFSGALSRTLENSKFDNFHYNVNHNVERKIAAFAQGSTARQTPRGTPRTSPRITHQLSQHVSRSDAAKTDKQDTEGKFWRTYRWNNVIATAEKKYGIETGILAGLAMRESYGDPLELNSGNDGGAGLFQFQPGTAIQYGLHTSGSSLATRRDIYHGLRLQELIERNHQNYGALARIDERFDVVKSTNAAARYLHDLKIKHGTWDKALSAYNHGTPAQNPGSTEHVTAVRAYQKYYLHRLMQLKNSVM